MFRGAVFFKQGGYRVIDPDAKIYIKNVEQADGQKLEDPIKEAFDNFIVSLKQKNLWSDIEHLVICGARTLNGALVPVKGTAPTVQGSTLDYNRFYGFIGSGSNNILSNVKGTDLVQNDNHVAAFVDSIPDVSDPGGALFGDAVGQTGAITIFNRDLGSANVPFVRHQSPSVDNLSGFPNNFDFFGISGLNRSQSSVFNVLFGQKYPLYTRTSNGRSGFTMRFLSRSTTNDVQTSRSKNTIFGYSMGTATNLIRIEECFKKLKIDLQKKRTLHDVAPGFSFAISLRKLNPNYTGNCIEITKMTDSTTKNIGFKNGYLDIDDMLNFLGSSEGRVRSWYDQSGNGVVVQNTDPATQPIFVKTGGDIYEEDGIKGIFFNSLEGLVGPSTGLFDNVPGVSCYAVCKFFDQTGDTKATRGIAQFGVSNTSTLGALELSYLRSANAIRVGGRRVSTDSFTSLIGSSNGGVFEHTRLVGGKLVPGQAYAEVDTNSIVSSFSTTWLSGGNFGFANSLISIGAFGITDRALNGLLSEVVFYSKSNRVVGDSDMTICENINDFYGLPQRGLVDMDAFEYITAVQNIDGQPLEDGVKIAIDDLFKDLKSENLWEDITQFVLLSGPRTLNGALIPLKGPAPDNLGLTSSQYNRKTGLKGDGTNVIDTKVANNGIPDECHGSVWIEELNTTGAFRVYLGSGTFGGTSKHFQLGRQIGGAHQYRVKSTADGNTGESFTGFYGVSRLDSSNIDILNGTKTYTNSVALQATDITTNFVVFGRNTPESPQSLADGRIRHWSLGNKLDLAKFQVILENYYQKINNLI